MEENREPQPPATSTIIYPPVYPVPQAPYYGAAPAAKPGRWLRMRRTLRLLLLRLLRGTTIVGRAIRPYAAFVVIILALLGVIGWMSYTIWGPKDSGPSFDRAPSLPPAPAIENFIRGQQTYNAEIMWEAYSDEFKASQLANGASKATLQSRANTERSMGLKYVHYDYIGGVQTSSGGMYFYSVDLAYQSRKGRFPIVFRADADGKIVEIESPLNQIGSSSGQ